MRVIETALDEDLSLFCRYLWQQRVRHRVFEERGMQVVELADPAQADTVRQAYEAFRSGRVQIREAEPAAGAGTRRSGLARALTRYPGLSVLIGLALLVFPFSLPMAEGRLTDLVAALAIIDPRLDPRLAAGAPVAPTLLELLGQLQVWRWFTPMLLHFSVLHLAFNCAVVIELGRRVESGSGALGFWVLVLAIGGLSNLGQYAFGGGPLFGGLSGVAYGLLGYLMVRHRLEPAVAAYQLPRGLIVGLLIFLVLFSTGVTEPFGLSIANAAHWGGLLSGALYGLSAGLLTRIRGGRGAPRA